MSIPRKNHRLSALTINNYFHFCGLSVYLGYESGCVCIVKGWCPKRFTDGYLYHKIRCDTLDIAYSEYVNLVKECIHYVQSSK